MKNIIDNIKLEEDLFPKDFTNFEEREFGILFYNTKTPNSYDSNHAVIYKEKIKNLSTVLQEITSFYHERNLQPSIYQAAGEVNYFIDNKTVFKSNGYTVWEEGPLDYMLLQADNQLKTSNQLRIERLEEWDERIANDIFIPSEEPWEIEVVKNNLKSPKYKVFVAYLEEKAVAITYFHISNLGCCRFDYIIVSKEYRKSGYARELLSYVTNYCRKNQIKNCYQWPANEISKKICFESGFRAVFTEITARASYSIKE